MAIPSVAIISIPFLRLLKKESKEIHMNDVIDKLAKEFDLSEDDLIETTLRGRKKFRHRIRWGRHRLLKAGWIESPQRGYVCITEDGLRFLETGNLPEKTNTAFWMQSEKYRKYEEWRRRKNEMAQTDEEDSQNEDETPDERIDEANKQIQRQLKEAENQLKEKLLERTLDLTPEEFEKFVLKLLKAMDYGVSQEHLGKPHDNGVDGVIYQDHLGFDCIYVQAKRYQPSNSISVGDIQRFAGSLGGQTAHRGVFITTSYFTASAEEEIKRQTDKHIVLIDGEKLKQLMIKYNVGCRETPIKMHEMNEEFFENL